MRSELKTAKVLTQDQRQVLFRLTLSRLHQPFHWKWGEAFLGKETSQDHLGTLTVAIPAARVLIEHGFAELRDDGPDSIDPGLYLRATDKGGQAVSEGQASDWL